MKTQVSKMKAVNKANVWKKNPGCVALKDHPSSFYSGETKPKGHYFLHFVSILMFVMAASGCEEQGSEDISSAPKTPPLPQQVNSSETIISSPTNQQQALKQINFLFKDELELIPPEQVQRINQQQFVQWLRNSKLAAAENRYLEPLLASNAAEFIRLKEVVVIETGEKAGFVLVAVPPSLYSRYSKAIILRESKGNDFFKVALRFACGKTGPEKCLCIANLESIPIGSVPPPSECGLDRECREPDGDPCDGDFEDIFEVDDPDF
jgi:hypothetical protein